jgi:hypothetical protein
VEQGFTAPGDYIYARELRNAIVHRGHDPVANSTVVGENIVAVSPPDRLRQGRAKSICVQVQLRRLAAEQERSALPTDVILCAMRVWDLRAERGFMKSIEDEFQVLAEAVITGTTTAISEPNKGKVDRFFALWKWRAHFGDADPEEVQFNNVTGARWTPEQEEQFERQVCCFTGRAVKCLRIGCMG